MRRSHSPGGPRTPGTPCRPPHPQPPHPATHLTHPTDADVQPHVSLAASARRRASTHGCIREWRLWWYHPLTVVSSSNARIRLPCRRRQTRRIMCATRHVPRHHHTSHPPHPMPAAPADSRPRPRGATSGRMSHPPHEQPHVASPSRWPHVAPPSRAAQSSSSPSTYPGRWSESRGSFSHRTTGRGRVV